MIDRKRKRKNKLRGKRTFGSGDTKNRRGAGSRGGKGKAGSKKHKFSIYYVFAGKILRRLKAKPKGKIVNVEYLNQKLEQLAKEKKIGQENGLFVVDAKKLGFYKILGRGIITRKMLVRNALVSRKAKEKIEAAGGKIEQLSGIEEAEDTNREEEN
ncbi:MAG: uL15m family ribosomal protein [archaeon]|nr:uL15m family ribosomal protein [archaeon]